MLQPIGTPLALPPRHPELLLLFFQTLLFVTSSTRPRSAQEHRGLRLRSTFRPSLQLPHLPRFARGCNLSKPKGSPQSSYRSLCNPAKLSPSSPQGSTVSSPLWVVLETSHLLHTKLKQSPWRAGRRCVEVQFSLARSRSWAKDTAHQ